MRLTPATGFTPAGRREVGYAPRRAQHANPTRYDRLHAPMVRLRITADTLRQIAQSAAREHYLPTSTDLAMMKRLHLEGALKERREGSRFRPIGGITNLRVKMEPQGREAESRRRAHGT